MKRAFKRIVAAILVAVMVWGAVPFMEPVQASALTTQDTEILELVNRMKSTYLNNLDIIWSEAKRQAKYVDVISLAMTYEEWASGTVISLGKSLFDASSAIDVFLAQPKFIFQYGLVCGVLNKGVEQANIGNSYREKVMSLYSNYSNSKGKITDPEIAREIVKNFFYSAEYMNHGMGYWEPFIEEYEKNKLINIFTTSFINSALEEYTISSLFQSSSGLADSIFGALKTAGDSYGLIQRYKSMFSTYPLDLSYVDDILKDYENPEVTTITSSYAVSSSYKKSDYYTNLTKVPLTGNQRTDIVNVALSQVGYHEGNSTSQLNGTNSKGTKNYTEYAYWFGTQVKENSYGHYYEWCAMFVSWCARQARIPVSVLNNAAYAKADGSSKSGGYSNFHIDYKNRGTYTPQPGDIIFFGSWDHVGIVYKVEGGKVYTIEGNASNKVSINSYSLNSSSIKCYGIPKYNSSASIQVLSNSSYNSLPVSGLTYSAGYYRVTPRIGLNIRKGPGTNYGVIRAVPKGTELKITEISGQWGKCDTGWVYMYYTEYIAPIEPVINVPAIPQLMLGTAKNIPVGSLVTVSWGVAADADSYDVYLKNSSGTICQSVNTKGTTAAFTISDAGTYTISANSRNSKYISSTSNVITVAAHNPSTVNFVDWDGSVLSSQTVAYGSSATAPGNPSRYGWTFERWDGNFNTVTENRTITAVYKRNVYTVAFLNEHGDVIGSKQKIEFESAATAPDYTAPEGYTFLGWDKEFDYIESNLTINPINVWTNEDLPVTISSTSDVVRSASGYTVTVNVINNPDKATDGRVIVALKTDDDKLLSMTESAAFHLKPDSDLDADKLGEERAIEVYVPYTGVATKANIYVVENFSKAIPISAVKSVGIDLGTDWTGWNTTRLEEYHAVESRKEYRYSTKSTKTSLSANLSGWTRIDKKTTSKWGSYGAWSGWTDSYIASSDSRQVETRRVEVTPGYTQYRYGSYYNGSRSYFCPCHISGEWLRYTEWSTTKYYPNEYSAWYCPNYGDFDNYRINGKDYYWEESRYIEPTYKTQYRYRDRSLVYTYYFEKWSDWSEWSTTPVTAVDGQKEVQTRTTYRYQVNDPSITADTSGQVRTISGALDPSLAGEQATLFIYKVDEASDFTNEYVGQTVIADDGSYSFTFKLREEPSVKTGDYTVTLGIEGTTASIYLDPIKAPKPEYTVTYIDWDGTEISRQTVKEGENTVIPEVVPEREGYDFICWNNTGTNVKDDMTISPVYRIKTYTVVFVDWTNETVEMQFYEHGQPLTVPEIESTEESIVAGWDTVVDGVLVTDNMIITAKYEPKTFSVKFMDADETLLEEVVVEYGQEVVTPEYSSNDNVLFYGWEASGDLESVKEDIIVVPKFEYKENTANPKANLVSGEYNGQQQVTLNCDTDGAAIYYTTDGSDPLDFGQEYSSPITISKSTALKFVACAFEKNDSEMVSVYLAINDNGNTDHIVTFAMDNMSQNNVVFVSDGETVDVSNLNIDREGHTFNGFYLDEEHTVAWDISNDAVTESIVLYPKWDVESYTATFVGFEGEILSEQTVNYSEYAEMPEVPDVEGYVFCGFDKDSLVVTEDTTFTAKYIPEDEFVTVSLNKSKYRLFNGTSTTLVASLTPSNVEDSYVYWTSSDENVAVVDDNGKVTAVGKGTAEIYAISNITGHVAVCKITVISNIDDDITLVDGTGLGFDSEGQLRGISVGENTVAEVTALFENESLTFVDINGNELADDDLVGTGTVIKLINEDQVEDEVVVAVTGDYNGDGLINNRDAAMITRYLVDKESASLTQLTAIDVNGDGYVNNRDASMVSRYLVGKETI